LFGIGQLIDLVMICTGQFTDAEGRVLRLWDNDPSAVTTTPAPPVAHPAPPVVQTDAPAQATPEPIAQAEATWNTPVAAPIAPVAQVNAPAVAPALPVASARIGRRITGGLFSALSALLVLVTLVVALSIGLDLPQAIALDLPDHRVAADIRRHLFGDFQNWPELARQLLYGVATLLTMLAVGFTMLARRHTSFFHILRGMIGIAGLILAITVLTSDFNAQYVWSSVAVEMNRHQAAPAVDAFLRPFRNPGPIIAAGICLVSFLILSLPHRRRAVKEMA
jgi:hypothetical protein